MRELKRMSVAKLRRDDVQPRKNFDEAELLSLGENMKKFGQQVPLIIVGDVLLDGERRWRAAQLVGITELDAIVLDKPPTVAELHILQMSVEAHKVGWSAMERSNFLCKIKEENHWSITELAERLSMKQPLVSKLLAYQKLCPQAQKMLDAGELDMEKAFIVSQEPDPEKQRILLTEATHLTREQMRQKARGNGEPVELKAKLARFPLVSGVVVIIQGAQVTLSGAIEAFQEVAKQLKQGQRQGLDITTAASVMRDRAKLKAG